MKHSDKPAGMTRAGRQHNSNAADSMAKDIEYEGFHDVDGYGRSYD